MSLVAALAAYWRCFLTLPAAVVATALGAAILFFGGWHWGAAAAGSFVLTSLLSQRQDRLENRARNFKKKPRNLNQLLANGLLLAVLAVLYRTTGENPAILAAYLGSVGAVAGDTWASAAAQFAARDPRLLTTGERVPPGTPGAITDAGLALSACAGFTASALYSFTAVLIQGETPNATVSVMLSIAATTGALAGSLFDSYLGASRQALYTDASGQLTDKPVDERGSDNNYVRGWRWLSNDLVNFSNAIAGALTAYLLWSVAATFGVV